MNSFVSLPSAFKNYYSMKVTLNWLKHYDWAPKELAEQLTTFTLEVADVRSV